MSDIPFNLEGIIDEMDKLYRLASIEIPYEAWERGKATDADMEGVIFPLEVWGITMEQRGEVYISGTPVSVKVVAYNVSPGATRPTIEFSTGRRPYSRGTPNLFYKTREDALDGINHLIAQTAKLDAETKLQALVKSHLGSILEAARIGLDWGIEHG